MKSARAERLWLPIHRDDPGLLLQKAAVIDAKSRRRSSEALLRALTLHHSDMLGRQDVVLKRGVRHRDSSIRTGHADPVDGAVSIP